MTQNAYNIKMILGVLSAAQTMLNGLPCPNRRDKLVHACAASAEPQCKLCRLAAENEHYLGPKEDPQSEERPQQTACLPGR